MMYFSFFLQYRRILAFSVLLAFFSSFGQTFLLSFYIPEFVTAFSLTEGRVGLMYGVATVVSALLLPWTGRRIDRMPLAGYTFTVTLAMALAAGMLAVAPHWVFLFLGLVALRHLGQGLCGHIAMTTAGKSFLANRGKAVAIAGTGFPLGEMLLPALVALGIATLGWRLSWGISALLILIVLAPVSLWLIRASRSREDALDVMELGIREPSVEIWRARDLLSDYRFYLILLALVPIGFFTTGFIFYQMMISESRGWGAHVFPTAFAAFAVTRALTALAAGPWIDKMTATRLLPAHMVLMLLSGAILVMFAGEWAAYGYLILLGMSMGTGQSVSVAVWAEVYGIENLGAIRSVASMVGVLSTALAPLIFGILLDLQVSVQAILTGALVLIALLTAFCFYASVSLERARKQKAMPRK